MMRKLTNRPEISILFLLAAPIAELTLGVGLGFFLGLNGTDPDISSPMLFLLEVFSIKISKGDRVVTILLYRFTAEELGLIIIKAKWGFHIAVSLAVISGYLLDRIYVIRFSGLRPVDSGEMPPTETQIYGNGATPSVLLTISPNQ